MNTRIEDAAIEDAAELKATLIDKYESDYKKALASIESEVKELIHSGKEMKGLMLFSDNLQKIIEVHEELNSLYSIIYSKLDVLKKFNSERLRQLGYEPIPIYQQLQDIDSDKEFIDTYVVQKLKESGFYKTHWWIKERVLTEIEYLIDTLRILIEPEFIPFEEKETVEPGKENTDRYVPAAVKLAVWRRDGGKCIECESKEKIEYDHIIPISKGGSNTERNIQLLCEKCNRKKGAQIQ